MVNWLDRENPQAGGAEAHLHAIFGRLAARGHHVTALTSGWRGCAPSADLDGISVRRAGRRYTFSLAAPLHYRRHLAGQGFDVVVEDLNKVPLFTPSWVRAPVLLLVHHLFGSTAFREANLPLALGTWLLERPVPRAFHRTPTVAVSESTRSDLIARGLPSGNIEVVHNGIELDRYRPGTRAERSAEPTILYVGRVKRYKGIDLLIRALALLGDRGVDARLLVAGTGPDRPELERLAQRVQVGDRVRFLGFVSEARKHELLRSSWIHALASAKEGWGLTCLEAAASGLPTVASDSPGLRDAVVDGRTGVLVPHGDVEALARAVGDLLADEGRREALGRAAVSFAAGFGWDASADAIEGILRRVVAGDRLG